MNKAHNAIDKAINEIDRLKNLLKKKTTKQINSDEETSILKATSLSWFNNHRLAVVEIVSGDLLADVDKYYREILSASDRSCTRSKYIDLLKSIRKEFLIIREQIVIHYTANSFKKTTDNPPEFKPLISDPDMQNILKSRWLECAKCLLAKAPLAATVMMGGLLEGLLLARINKESDKTVIFKAKTVPKDKAGKTLSLKEWTLKNYIEVAHELKWISHSAKDIGEVLRDYRNYIHPQKELSHGIVLREEDAQLFWEVSKAISKQIIGKIN